MMLTFAISLLFTAGAALAVLVIVGMIAANWQAIGAALAGQGAFGNARSADGTPPLVQARLRVGPLRRGRGRTLRPAAGFSPLRAAA